MVDHLAGRRVVPELPGLRPEGLALGNDVEKPQEQPDHREVGEDGEGESHSGGFREQGGGLREFAFSHANRVVVSAAMSNDEHLNDFVSAPLAHAVAVPTERKHDTARANYAIQGITNAAIECSALRFDLAYSAPDLLVAFSDLAGRIGWVKDRNVEALALVRKHVAKDFGVHVVKRRRVGVQVVGDIGHTAVASERVHASAVDDVAAHEVPHGRNGQRVAVGHRKDAREGRFAHLSHPSPPFAVHVMKRDKGGRRDDADKFEVAVLADRQATGFAHRAAVRCERADPEGWLLTGAHYAALGLSLLPTGRAQNLWI